MELVVDWNSVCLVCLQQGEMKSIYEKDEKNITLSDKIMLCSSIEIDDGMSLPEQICFACYDDLLVAYRFRNNCESTNIILKSLIKTNENDVEIPSSSGEIYKYKIPVGLELKRIKVKQNSDPLVIKSEMVELEPEPEEEELVDHDVHSYDDEFVVHELDEDDEPLANFRTKSMDPDELEHLDDKNLVEIFDNGEKELELIQVDLNQLPAKKRKKQAPPKNSKGRGRPRNSSLKTGQVPYDGAVQDIMDNLTSVTYVRKITRDDGKPLKICEICGNTYKYQHALDSHMRRHRNEKPFACEFCDRAFVANVELRRHMRVHTGQKPYACRFCDRRFSDFGSRIKHERTHTGERPYECATCGKAFAYAHVLNVHQLTHTGEKKFKCDVCGKGFTKKSYLVGHMKLHKDPVVSSTSVETNIESTIETTNPPDDPNVELLTELVVMHPKVEKDQGMDDVYFEM